MNPDRARQVHDLFEQALDCGTAEREALLASRSPETREEVEALLASFREMGDFLGRSAAEQLTPRPLDPGTRIGAYRIVRVIGAGGGGTVYEAEQQSPQRRVALKVRQGGLGSSASQRRFREEAEILARLQHPDIAHVYEAGVHEGVPWFALEYVPEARNLIEHASTLDLPARLRLFERVCNAIHHGHQKGIVHRDLKPSNILVLPDGHPKIIDFGIARVEGIGATKGELVGTPPWMSPEQCVPGNEDVDVRSDVYALGVCLYQLLSGRLPHDVSCLTITEATRLIRDEDPAPLPATIPPDLRAVVGMALARERENRYASAAELGRDLLNFLAHLPVAARRAGRLHRVRLFTRRNPGVAFTLVLLMVVLAGATIVSSRYALRATAARDRERRLAYEANLAAAHSALRLYDGAEARRLLSLAPESLRGIEWSYLVGRLDTSTESFTDPDSYELYAVPLAGSDRILGFGQSPDPRKGAIILWDRDRHEMLSRVEIESPARCLPALDPTGATVAWGTWEGGIRLADPETPLLFREIDAHDEQIADLSYTPAGDALVSTSEDGYVRIWEPASGLLRTEIGDGSEPYYCARVSPDGTLLAASRGLCTVELFDLAGGALLHELTGHLSRITVIRFSPDGRRLITASTDGTVRVWEAASGRELDRLSARNAPILSGDLSSDGLRLVTGHADGSLTLWNLESGLPETIRGSHGSWLKTVRFLPDGLVMSAGRDRSVKLWDLEGPDAGVHDDYAQLVRDLDYSPDGHWLAACDFSGGVRLFAVDEPGAEFDLEGHRGRPVAAVDFSADSRKLASIDGDGLAKLWDVDSRTCERSWIHPSETGLSIAFDPRGRLLATGGKAEAALWDLASGSLVHSLPHTSWVWTVLFSPDGRQLVTTTHDGWLHIWDADTGAPVFASRLMASELPCATWTADGKTLITAGASHVFLWDAATWTRRATWKLPTVYIQGIAPSPDGRRLVVGGSRNLRVVDLDSGMTLLSLPDHATLVWDVAFHPDGTQFASAAGGYEGQGCMVHLWGRLPGMPWPPSLR